MKYHRVLLKLSGEALLGPKNVGIDAKQLAFMRMSYAKLYPLACPWQ